MNKVIRVLIVDDHLVVREGLRFILEGYPEIELVGDAADGTAAIALAGELQPDVILMDVRMPGTDGITAIAQIRQAWPQIAVVILTTYDDDELLVKGFRAGACGYLIKDTNRETLFHAILTAARGETLLQPAMMGRLFAQAPSPSSSSQIPTHSELTAREQAVLAGVARGERNKEIAARLHISEPTVKSHLASIYFKLGVDSRAAAVAAAIERGLLSPQKWRFPPEQALPPR